MADPLYIDDEVHADWLHPLRPEGFKGFVTVAMLQDSRCSEVPQSPGVYLVIRHREILYIGKAGGPGRLATLRTRLHAYMRYGQGHHASGHRGGRDIWDQPNAVNFTVAWKATPYARDEEKRLLSEFEAEHGKLPLANHRR